MNVKVNGKNVEIFAGARVRDVLLKYSRKAWAGVRDDLKKVYDAHGHEVGLGGELNGGEELFVRTEPRKGGRA